MSTESKFKDLSKGWTMKLVMSAEICQDTKLLIMDDA